MTSEPPTSLAKTHSADHRVTWPGAPQVGDANAHRVRLIRRLRRFATQFPGAAELAECLDGCKNKSRCSSGACPVCLTFAQRRVVRKLLAEFGLRNNLKPRQLVAVSVMSPSWRAAVGHLDQFDRSEVRNDLSNALGRAGHFSAAWFGLDVSLNNDAQKGYGVYWQAQAYGIALVEDRQLFTRAPRRQFQASEHLSRPVRIVKCDGAAHALSYCFKTNFVRRIAYLSNGISRSGKPRNCWRTRKVWLMAKEEVELRLWLHRIGLRSRILHQPSHFKQKKVVTLHLRGQS